MNIKELKVDLAQKSKWNIGYFIAGFMFWVFVEVTAIIYPLESAAIFWLVGTFFIFPISVLFSKFCRADPFSKDNHLGDLVGFTHMSIITLSLPIVLVVFVYLKDALQLTMAILYCIDFYVMSWAFGSAIFGVSAAVRVLLVSMVWIFLPNERVALIPIIVALSYLALIVLIPIKRKNWLAINAQNV